MAVSPVAPGLSFSSPVAARRGTVHGATGDTAQGQVVEVPSPTSSTARGEGRPLQCPCGEKGHLCHVPVQVPPRQCHQAPGMAGQLCPPCSAPSLSTPAPRALSIPLDPPGLHAAPLPSAAGMCRVPRVAPFPGPCCPGRAGLSPHPRTVPAVPRAAGLPHRLPPEPGCPWLLVGLSQHLGGTEASECCT